MIGRTVRHAILSRRATLALLTGAFLPRPPVVRAQTSGTCIPPNPGENLVAELTFEASGSGLELTGRLRLQIDAEGHAQMDGAILVVSALDGPMPHGRPLRLVARAAETELTCEDRNEDGVPGITAIRFHTQPAGGGDLVLVALTTREGEELPFADRIIRQFGFQVEIEGVTPAATGGTINGYWHYQNLAHGTSFSRRKGRRRKG